ncbi:MAG: trypsin-like peptidase domain-containing protein [Phycisphaerae bacterium]|nr:trypsin-like peptidase domain-containing protein [Phycisphaerae bacterium]
MEPDELFTPRTIPPRVPPQREARRQPLLWILFLVLLGWLAYREFGGWLHSSGGAPRAVTPRGDLAGDEKSTIELFENAAPSVVYITSVALRQDFFGLNVTEIPQGTGSGVIWDRAGHVITNFHVIKDASAVEVMLSDRSTWKAELVGVEPDKDIAVLKIGAPPGKLTPIPIGESQNLQVGQKTFAIGNPFGLDHTLTTGVVSALGRSIKSVTGRTIEDVVQTDAAINPGNSGGPLLDSAGRLIGVNTAIYSPSGSSAGIGFAVPVDTVNNVVPQLIAHGKVTRPRLGVVIAHDTVLRRIGVPGVLILNVEEGSGAAAAGLRGTRRASDGSIVLGDIIQRVDGTEVSSRNELLDALEKHKPGETVELTILRDDDRMTVRVTMQP